MLVAQLVGQLAVVSTMYSLEHRLVVQLVDQLDEALLSLRLEHGWDAQSIVELAFVSSGSLSTGVV